MSLFPLLCAFVFSMLFTAQARADLNDIQDIKKAFLKHLESRNQYLDQLAVMRFKIMMNQEKTTSGEETEISAIDKEMLKSPLPSNCNSKILSRLRVGEWESPRHDYLYRTDGSWTMLPITPHVTQGRWKIERNLYYDWMPNDDAKEIQCKIILLDENYFVSSMGNHLFYERKIEMNVGGWFQF